jgi:ATP-dependent Clp protease ATP-binding subunit ClpA/protein subunit release factor B
LTRTFRLFVRRHENGTYTVTVPGLRDIPGIDRWDEEGPETSSLASHGLILEEVKADVREALEKWLSRCDPDALHRADNYRLEQRLERVEVELRANDSRGRKRRDRVKLKISLMVTREEEQYRVMAPKLTEPPLSFFCYNLDELEETASRELAAYFADFSFEALLPYQYDRQEYLDTIEVEFSPLKPQREKKRAEKEEEFVSWALKNSAVNLSARAKERRLTRAFRRDTEVNEILNALATERGDSVLLVGDSGVGKTAIVHEAVRRISEESCPAALRGRTVWHTSANQLIAGCMFIGQWQEKLQNIVEDVKRNRHLLFVDDVVGLLEAGRWSKSDDNMAQFLKPYLADGTVSLIGETSVERYRVGENIDPGFLGHFRTLTIKETDEQTTLSIAGATAASLERVHRLRIEPSAREAAIELTRRFQPYRAFPGKAIGLLEQVAADLGGSAKEERPVLSRQVLVRAFARQTGMPEFILSDHLTMEPAAVEQYFRERLIGQPHAVECVVDLVTVIKAGLNDPHKPLGCFFFVGPTGVGKTEMAKTLAEYLFGSRDRMIRFDMSEYAEPLNVARLIGAARGREEGELTKQIRLQPFSVVLLDEFEKAHPSIFDVMLQVLGEGRVTDACGRTADFRSAIVLMTSNLGASAREQRRPSLRRDENRRAIDDHYRKQVEGFFRPEFVNRLDQIVVFRPLDREAMRQIASRELTHLLDREGITRRNLLVEVDDAVIDLLLETGFSPTYGARPLKREIERRVIVPLARHLVAHRAVESQLLQVKREEDEIRLVSTTLATARERVKAEAAPLVDADASRKMDAKELVEGFAAQRLRLHQWTESETTRQIDAEYTRLLARTREPEFAAYGAKTHRVWTRIAHMERLLKRLRQLTDRAEYLEEFAALTHRQREQRYQPDLAESFTDLCRDTDYLEIELLCAHLEESDQALLRLRSLGRARSGARAASAQEPWSVTLAKVYLRWSKRKGYDYSVFVPTPLYARWIESQGSPPEILIPGYRHDSPPEPPWAEITGSDFNNLLRLLEALAPREIALSLRGTNVYGFLRGEAGAHKLMARPDDSDAVAPFQTVAVVVECLEEETTALARLREHWENEQHERLLTSGRARRQPEEDEESVPAREGEAPPIIRIIMPDGDRFVRDTRTGLRTTQVRDVLDGQIDAFILAYLRTEEPELAWDRP